MKKTAFLILIVIVVMILSLLLFKKSNEIVTVEQAINIARGYNGQEEHFVGYKASFEKKANIWVVKYYDNTSSCQADCMIYMDIDAKTGKILQVISEE